MDEGWLELSVSSPSCLSSSILAVLTDSLPSRTACKPGSFIFLTCMDPGSTARSRQAHRAGLVGANEAEEAGEHSEKMGRSSKNFKYGCK